MTTLFSSPPAGKPLRFLALGDSYTIGEAVPEQGRWPVQLAKALSNKGIPCEEPVIIATTGWRTDQLKAAIDQANFNQTFDIVSLLIGVNNQYQGKDLETYEKDFETLLKEAIRLAGGNRKRVFVVSIPDYGFTPFGKQKQVTITQGIDKFNSINRAITTRESVAYIDITSISRLGLQQPELVAEDGLHPSEKMYSRWVEKIMKEWHP